MFPGNYVLFENVHKSTFSEIKLKKGSMSAIDQIRYKKMSIDSSRHEFSTKTHIDIAFLLHFP